MATKEPIVRGGFYRYRTPITQNDVTNMHFFQQNEADMLARLSSLVEIGDIIKETSNDASLKWFYGVIGSEQIVLPRRWILTNFDHVDHAEPIMSEPSLGGKKTRRRRRKTKRRKHKKRYSRKYRKN